jgi:hypothetical protein
MKLEELKLRGLTILAVGGGVVFPMIAECRDLVSASNSAANTVKTVAQALAVTGVVGGGAIMQIPGGGDVGKRVAVSGLIGCACAFGAPAFISLMRSVFGG